MKTPLTYGFIMALAGALLSLLLYLTGYHDDPQKMKSAQLLGSLGGVIIGVVALSLAMREERAAVAARADGEWGYGSAFGTGVLTGVFGAMFGAIFAYIYFAIINPGMTDVMVEMQISTMEEKGMSASQIDAAEPMMRRWMSPGIMTAIQAFFGFLWTMLFSLIVAIFYRKPAARAKTGLPPAIG